MSALFGHVQGRVHRRRCRPRRACCAAANGGVLFLDEIGELGLDEQAMLLRAHRGEALPAGRRRQGGRERLPAHRRHQPRSARARSRDGRFREDLLARINLWTFALPGLDRPRGHRAQPRLRARRATQRNRDATSPSTARRAAAFCALRWLAEAVWSANFRDLGAAVTRMATLAPGGRINEAIVAEEIERLRRAWMRTPLDPDADLLQNFIGAEKLQNIDLFDRAQLAAVLRVCREAGRLAPPVGRCLPPHAPPRPRSTTPIG